MQRKHWIIVVIAASSVVLLVGGIAFAITAVPMGFAFFLMSGTGAQASVCAPVGASSTSAGAMTVKSSDGGSVTLSAKQMGYVATAVQIGTQEGVNGNGLVAIIAAGLTESGMRNLANSNVPDSLSYPNDGTGHDHTSVNPWQEQNWWGTTAQRMNIEYAVKAWFGGPNGPNHGSPRGLLDIPNWQDYDPATMAQLVEVSAYPDRYQPWVSAAQQLVGAAGGASCLNQAATGWTAPNGKTGADVVAYAKQFVGKVPYGNDCGSAGNPSGAWCCTGFVYWVYHQVLGIDLTSPVVSGQLALAHQIPQSQAQAGDLVAWVGQHIGIYDGSGHVIAAADWGEGTKISSLPFQINGVSPTYWRVNTIGNGSW